MLNKELLLHAAAIQTSFKLSFRVSVTPSTGYLYSAEDISPNPINVFGVPSTISAFTSYWTSNDHSTLIFSNGYTFSPNNDWCWVQSSTFSSPNYLICESPHRFSAWTEIFREDATEATLEFFRKQDQKTISVKLNAIDTSSLGTTLNGNYSVDQGKSIILQLPANSFVSANDYMGGYFRNPVGCEASSKDLRLFDTDAEIDIYRNYQ